MKLRDRLSGTLFWLGMIIMSAGLGLLIGLGDESSALEITGVGIATWFIGTQIGTDWP